MFLGDCMYTLINNKKYNIISMNSFFKRLKGLMFKKEAIKDIYLFPKCSSIHTYFMKQNIDVCIIDKKNIITYTKSNVKKRSIIIKKGYSTLEMPLGTCKHLKIGDTLTIKK